MADQKAAMCVKVDYDDTSFIFERQSHFATKEEVGRGSITHEGQALYDNIEMTMLDHTTNSHMYVGSIETKEFVRVFELLGLNKGVLHPVDPANWVIKCHETGEWVSNMKDEEEK